jgi:hypothetical protein
MCSKKWVLLVVAAVFVGVAGNWLVSICPSTGDGTDGHHGQAPNKPGLAVSKEFLDFGEVWEESHFNWVLSLENKGEVDIAISKFHTSCSCTAITPESLSLQPGESRQVHLTVDLGPKPGNESPADVEQFEVAIQPAIKGERGWIPLASWQLTGRVKRVLAVAPPSGVNFGRHSEFAQPLPVQEVRITPKVPLARLSAKCRSKSFGVVIHKTAATPTTEHYTLSIRPDQLPLGVHRSEIDLMAEVDKGCPVCVRSIPVQAEILRDIQTTPAKVQLGAKSLGEKCQEAVNIHSLSGLPFEVARFSTDNPELQVRQLTELEAGQPHTFLLSQEITAKGRQVARATFTVVTANGKSSNITVPVEYLGSMPK